MKPAPQSAATLDNLTLARKEGFRCFAEAEKPKRPDMLTLAELRALSTKARAAYDKRRREWHANLGPIRTPQLDAVHSELWSILDSNLQYGDKPKGAVAVEAAAGLGKTTATLTFARDFHRREIDANGRETSLGDERWPVCRIGMTGRTTFREFNRSILYFYGHPGTQTGNASAFAHRALDTMIACSTKVLLIDDFHFLDFHSTDGRQISNHIKFIENEFPMTLIVVGIGLSEKGLYTTFNTTTASEVAQTARRTTTLSMRGFSVDNLHSRREWRSLLKSFEKYLVLCEMRPGMLAEAMPDYLFWRTSGHIGSLTTLLSRGCGRAMRTRAEVLTTEILDHVRIDEAAELQAHALREQFRTGKLSTRVAK